ncbi:MAG: hypothetical protein D6744_02140, partial [Planctomycetota bacterium]
MTSEFLGDLHGHAALDQQRDETDTQGVEVGHTSGRVGHGQEVRVATATTFATIRRLANPARLRTPQVRADHFGCLVAPRARPDGSRARPAVQPWSQHV